MGLDYVDIFYSHRVDPDTPLEETMGALDTAVHRARRSTSASRRTPPRRPREAAAILRDLGTPLLIHQPSYSHAQPLDRARAARRARRAGNRLHRLLPARAGHADRQVPQRDPGGLARDAATSSLSPDLLTDEALGEDPRAERDRRGARSEPGPDGARLGAARPARHLDARRREQRRAARGQRGRARSARLHRRSRRQGQTRRITTTTLPRMTASSPGIGS